MKINNLNNAMAGNDSALMEIAMYDYRWSNQNILLSKECYLMHGIQSIQISHDDLIIQKNVISLF